MTHQALFVFKNKFMYYKRIRFEGGGANPLMKQDKNLFIKDNTWKGLVRELMGKVMHGRKKRSTQGGLIRNFQW